MVAVDRNSLGENVRLATYNTMFCMDGRNTAGIIRSIIAVHILRSERVVHRYSRYLKDVFSLVAEIDPKILCLNEILLSIHGAELTNELKDMGYVSIVEGKTTHHKHPLEIGSILASKYNCEDLNFQLPFGDRTGGGGGSGALYIPDLNLTAVGVHLGVRPKYRREHISVLVGLIRQQMGIGRHIAILGDFNKEFSGNNLFVDELGLRDYTLPSYPAHGSGTHFQRKFDHIFLDPGINVGDIQRRRGLSDHFLLYCSLREG